MQTRYTVTSVTMHKANNRVLVRRSHSVELRWPLDIPTFRSLLETDLNDVAVKRMKHTAEAIGQSYGQLVTPIRLFLYRLDRESLQFSIKNATKLCVSFITDMKNNHISPLTSPDWEALSSSPNTHCSVYPNENKQRKASNLSNTTASRNKKCITHILATKSVTDCDNNAIKIKNGQTVSGSREAINGGPIKHCQQQCRRRRTSH